MKLTESIMTNLREGQDEDNICVLCKKKFRGWGNDAWPLADGYCCDKCNSEKVLPARIAQMYGLKKESNLKEADDDYEQLSLDFSEVVGKRYTANFELEVGINGDYFNEAQEYLSEDDMTEYIPESLKGVVTKVEWILDDDYSGRVVVDANRELTEEEQKEMTDWIDGQNSDGLGEGFEQQKFAEVYYNPYTGDGPYDYRECTDIISDMYDRMDPSDYVDYIDESAIEDAIDKYLEDYEIEDNEENREEARSEIEDAPEEYLDYDVVDNAKQEAIDGNDEYNENEWYTMASIRRPNQNKTTFDNVEDIKTGEDY